jgi:hypothetical protein
MRSGRAFGELSSSLLRRPNEIEDLNVRCIQTSNQHTDAGDGTEDRVRTLNESHPLSVRTWPALEGMLDILLQDAIRR